MPHQEIHSTEKVVEVLSGIQQVLEQAGIESWIGGGVGADLLREKYMPGEAPRNHGDGDLYIPLDTGTNFKVT